MHSDTRTHFDAKFLNRRHSGLYNEFLSTATLSAGIYHLEAGTIDPQKPHNEDEVYYILSGRGSIEVGQEKYPVHPGDAIYVPAHRTHKFVDITEDLEILVFFSKAIPPKV